MYAPSGHIIYQTDRYESGLWALPFSIDTLKPTGAAFPIAQEAVEPSVSADGTLVYIDLFGSGQRQLEWRDRDGTRMGSIGQPQLEMSYPALSPNGRLVAVSSRENGNQDIWVHEVERPIKRRLTSDPGMDTRPVWSPSGEEITFQSTRQGNYDIFRRPADDTGEPVFLFGTDRADRPYSWSSDGSFLLFTATSPGTRRDVWYLKRKDDGGGFEAVSFVQTPFAESAPQFSPDDRFVAYCSTDSGQAEVYVRPFPEGGASRQVSTDGGCQPRWSRTGRELFYVRDDTLMAVDFLTTPELSFGSPEPLFSYPSLATTNANQVTYDVSADGKRFVLVGVLESLEDAPPALHVVENWYEEFRERGQD